MEAPMSSRARIVTVVCAALTALSGAPLGAQEQADSVPAILAPRRSVFFEEERAVAGARLELAEAAEAPVVTRGDVYRAGLLVQEESISPVGRLVELVSPSVVPLENPPQIAPFARVYLTLTPGRSIEAGERLHLIRAGRRVTGFGRIFESTGVVRVLSVQDGVATAEVELMYDAVRVGDLAVPLPPFSPRFGLMAAEPEQRLEGRIVAFLNPHPLQNLHDLAFVDLGAASGVVEGDEFSVVLPPERRPWGTRPEIVVARLRVVRTAQRTAAVKVIELDYPALQPGLPVRLVTRMR